MENLDQITKTLSLRVKDKHAAALIVQSREVDFVWNFINDLSQNTLNAQVSFLVCMT